MVPIQGVKNAAHNPRRDNGKRFGAKKSPMGTVAAGEGFPVAILNRNEPAFYCVPAKAFEALMDRLEDFELNAIADARKGQKEIEVSIDELYAEVPRQRRRRTRAGARRNLVVALHIDQAAQDNDPDQWQGNVDDVEQVTLVEHYHLL
jgi:antitoxin StbD